MENQTNSVNKKRDVFRICNFVFASVLAAMCIVMMFYHISIGDPNGRVLACAISTIPFFAPFLIELIINRRFGNFTILIYLVFVFYAAFIGSVLGLFKTSSVLDKIAHTVFGYLGCYLGLALSVNTISKKEHPWFVLVVCFFTSMAFAALWEVFEFSGDTFFSQTAQGYPVNGITDVTDTMLDITVNLAGAIVFVIQYILHILTKKNLFIETMAKDLTLKTRQDKTRVEKE